MIIGRFSSAQENWSTLRRVLLCANECYSNNLRIHFLGVGRSEWGTSRGAPGRRIEKSFEKPCFEKTSRAQHTRQQKKPSSEETLFIPGRTQYPSSQKPIIHIVSEAVSELSDSGVNEMSELIASLVARWKIRHWAKLVLFKSLSNGVNDTPCKVSGKFSEIAGAAGRDFRSVDQLH